MTIPDHVTEVEYLDGYRLRMVFADGLVTVLDLVAKLLSEVGPAFEPPRDPALLVQVSVDGKLGTIVWPNAADLPLDPRHDEAVTVA